jgi:hypothetical protein
MTIAGDLLLKVVSSFAADGLRKAYQEIRGGIRRRQSVDRTLSGENPASDHRLKRALDDLSIVIGTTRGQLNESVAAFLREIERSAIPEALVKSVLTNVEPAKIFPAFDLIYKTCEADPCINSRTSSWASNYRMERSQTQFFSSVACGFVRLEGESERIGDTAQERLLSGPFRHRRSGDRTRALW